MKAEIENPLERGELSHVADMIPGATFFHSAPWLDALEGAYGNFRVLWLTLREAGALVGAMPVVRSSRGPLHRLLSLPFGTYGDPLARDAASRRAMLETFFDMAASPRCVEASVSLFGSQHLGEPPRGVRVRTEECRLVLLEGGFEQVWSRASSKRRQLSRRGEEAGVVVRPLESEAELRRFHEIYREESREWGGVHPYPVELFLALFARRAEGVIVWGAFLDGALLGAHIDFYRGDMAQAWQGGMTARAKEYETGALLIKKAMEEACRRGMRVFNLGSSGGNEGILFFKESLGGVEHRYQIWETAKGWWRLARRR